MLWSFRIGTVWPSVNHPGWSHPLAASPSVLPGIPRCPALHTYDLLLNPCHCDGDWFLLREAAVLMLCEAAFSHILPLLFSLSSLGGSAFVAHHWDYFGWFSREYCSFFYLLLHRCISLGRIPRLRAFAWQSWGCCMVTMLYFLVPQGPLLLCIRLLVSVMVSKGLIHSAVDFQ